MRSVARLIRRSLAGLVVCACGLDLAGPGFAAANTTWHTYSNAAGTRSYLLEVPARPRRNPPLVVFLHGCNQTAAGVAHDTGWARLADERGFIAVFPQEPPLPTDTLLKGCWGWEQSANQHRGSGEPAIIAGITDQVATAEHVDRRRIYVTGFSAGGYMANIMAVTYPDTYAAVGIVAGGPYGLGLDAAPDPSGQAIVAAMGPRARAVPVIVVQATNDNINPFAAGFGAAQQWLDAYDLIDDGQRNDSVSHVPASIEAHAGLAAPHPGRPTICDQLAPCPGGATGLASYPYTVAHYLNRRRQPLLDFLTIEGANHDYTGGTGTFMDPTGPSTTAATRAFLFAQRR